MEDNKQPIIFEQSREMSNRKHILVIDDDPETLKTLRYYLQDRYKVSVVSWSGSDPSGLPDADVQWRGSAENH